MQSLSVVNIPSLICDVAGIGKIAEVPCFRRVRAWLDEEKALNAFPSHIEEFRGKVEELGAIGHGNLVPLRAYYYGRDEKLIVYDSTLTSLSILLHDLSSGVCYATILF
ncbi:hypothetical protein RND71_003348 [Anisodus tanguticus]|uniref:Protein kinase domain-containing protein n=1 Tax=Anisodus tanguticus TaxID=243964 RepID=A0AAE1SVQ5_9SOLA|nr:hypothetical protein RND71_003348 [Anisodus tanguticus]